MKKTEKEHKRVFIYSIFEFFNLAMEEFGKNIAAGQDKWIDGEVSSPKWDRNRSNQHMQSLSRHLLAYSKGEKVNKEDGTYHLAAILFRAAAQLQLDLEKEQSIPKDYDEDKSEKRMNIIGQNGNEGEHYEKGQE